MTKPATPLSADLRSKAISAILGPVEEDSPAPAALAQGLQATAQRDDRLPPGQHDWGVASFKLNTEQAHKLIKRGIPSRAIGPVGEYVGLGKGAMAAYLDLDRSTANRLASKDQALPAHSGESVLRLLELKDMACDTFECEEQASAWLNKAHPMLDGETPLEAAKTSYGAQRVKDILLAVKYGGVL